MGHSQYDLAGRDRPAWNASKRVGVKRPLKVRQIWEIRFFLDREGRSRDERCSISRLIASCVVATW
jgi:hypothetical protein